MPKYLGLVVTNHGVDLKMQFMIAVLGTWLLAKGKATREGNGSTKGSPKTCEFFLNSGWLQAVNKRHVANE